MLFGIRKIKRTRRQSQGLNGFHSLVAIAQGCKVMTIGLMLLLMTSSSSASPLIKPEVKLTDIRIVSITLSGLRLMVDLSVQNPNDKALDVKSLEYAVKMDGRLIKKDVINKQIIFSAKSARKVSIPVSLAYDKNLSSVIAALTQKTTVYYQLSGKVHVAKEPKPIPFSEAGKITPYDYINKN